MMESPVCRTSARPPATITGHKPTTMTPDDRTPSPRSLGLFFALAMAATLGGCAAGVGVSVPVGPFSVGVGVNSRGDVSAGAGTRVGPVGVGVGVNPGGQVTGHAGVGTSTQVGNGRARVGAAVGASTVIHDPQPANTR